MNLNTGTSYQDLALVSCRVDEAPPRARASVFVLLTHQHAIIIECAICSLRPPTWIRRSAVAQTVTPPSQRSRYPGLGRQVPAFRDQAFLSECECGIKRAR